MKKVHQAGFTLIELIVVIILLGILSVVAAPRFLDLSEDAYKSVVKSTASSFEAGVKLVHYKWLISGNGQAIQDFIPISDVSIGGSLSVNEFGYPADTRGVSLTLNSDNDCLDVFRAVLSTDMTTEENTDSTFRANYEGGGVCTYEHNKAPQLVITYDSITGEVSTAI